MTPVSARDGVGSLSAATLAALQSPQTMGMNAIEPYMTPFTKMNGLAKVRRMQGRGVVCACVCVCGRGEMGWMKQGCRILMPALYAATWFHPAPLQQLHASVCAPSSHPVLYWYLKS